MKFSIDRTKFLKPLSHLSSVVERRNTIPILSNIVVSANDDSLSLTATDMDLDLVITIKCNIEQKGTCTIPAHLLSEIVRKFQEGSQVQIFSDQNNVNIIAGKSNFRLPTLPVEEFPSFSSSEMSTKFQLMVEDVIHQIDKTRFAISNEETRFYLNGIYFHKNDNGMLASVATDGHRLAVSQMKMPENIDDIPQVILPKKAIGEIRKLIDDYEGKIDISLSETRAEFSFGNVKLTTKLIDGSFPDYTKVIPTNNDKIMTVNTEKFYSAVDRVSTISSEKSRSVKINLRPGVLVLSASNPDASSAIEEIEVSYDGEEIEIGFNARYLIEIAQQINNDTMQIALSDPGSPSLIFSPNDKNNLFVLMPMRV